MALFSSAQARPRSVSCAFACDVFVKDSQDLGNPLGTVFGAVTGRNNLLRFGSVEMRTPIRHHAVAAIGNIAASTIADDRVIRNAFCHWQAIHFLYERIVRRKGIDTVR